MKYLPNYGRQGHLTTYFFHYETRCTGKIQLKNKKSDFGITKNYKGVTRTFIDAKVYFALLLNWIRPEVEKTFRRHQKKSIHNFTDSDYPSNHRSTSKKSRFKTIDLRFLQVIWLHTQREDWFPSL